jgi:hypothetical protein
MTRGLLTPLSPIEEIGLRRVAHGSPIIDVQVAANLCRLALIERTRSGLRLTPLGRQRYDAMPKALLLIRRHSLHAIAGYVEGLLEKAQLRAGMQQPKARVAPLPSASRTVALEDTEAPCDDDARDDGAPMPDVAELKRWKNRAERGVDKAREVLLVQRAKDAELREMSRERIEMSRVLLNETMPAKSP